MQTSTSDRRSAPAPSNTPRSGGAAAPTQAPGARPSGLRGMSYDAGAAALAPAPVQNTAATTGAKAAGGKAAGGKAAGGKAAGGKAAGGKTAAGKAGSGRVQDPHALADIRFKAEWKLRHNKPEAIDDALEATRKAMEGGYPADYVPPPRRAGAAPAATTQPEAAPAAEGADDPCVPVPDDPSEGYVGTDEAGNPQSIVPSQDEGGNPITQVPQDAPATSAGAPEAAPDAADPGPTRELGLPMRGPFGMSIGYDARGPTEASGKVELKKLPSVEAFLVPGVKAVLKPELAGSIKAKLVAGGGFDCTFEVALSAVGSIQIGLPKVGVGAGLELKGAVTWGATYRPGKGWGPQPVQAALSGAFVLVADVGFADWKYPVAEAELAVMTLTASGPKFSKGKDVDAIVKAVTSWPPQETGPDAGESGAGLGPSGPPPEEP